VFDCSCLRIMVPPHGKTNLVKAFIINYLKQLIFQKVVPKAVHRQTKTLYKYSTLRSESGKRAYSITAKRIISGLVLKYLNGECFMIRRVYKTTLHSSSSLCLTAPILGYKIWLRNSLVRESCAFLKKVSGGPCSTITPRSVK